MNNLKGKEEKELSQLYGLATIGLVFVLSPVVLWVATTITQNFGFDASRDFIPVVRLLMTVLLPIVYFPCSIWIEFVYSRWKKRKYRLSNIFVVFGMMDAGILIMIFVSLVFELIFPRISFAQEPIQGLTGLAFGLMIGSPALTVGLLSRIPRIRRYLKRTF